MSCGRKTFPSLLPLLWRLSDAGPLQAAGHSLGKPGMLAQGEALFASVFGGVIPPALALDAGVRAASREPRSGAAQTRDLATCRQPAGARKDPG